MEKINDEIDLLKDIPILRVSSGDYRNEFMEEKVQNKKKRNTSQLLSSAATMSKAGLEKYLSRERL
jgi:hypothetical protein